MKIIGIILYLQREIGMKKIFKRLGIFIENKRLLLIILAFVLIIPAALGAQHLKMETGFSTFISEDSPEYQDYARFTSHFSDNVLAVLITGDDIAQLLDPVNLAAMETIENEMGGTPNVLSTIGPAFFLKQAMYQQTGTAALPGDAQTALYIVTDPATGEIRPEFSGIFPDEQHALIAVTLDGGLSQDDEADIVETAREAVDQAGLQGVDAIVTGAPTIWSEISDLMMSSMKAMMLVSMGLMLLILALIFIVRGFFAWRWLPLGVVFIGIIYTFGIMGVLSIPITMVTMAVFPIIIGLGVDYAIQFHNRYDEESRRGETVKEAIVDAVTHIGPAIGVAIITACLGFAALYFSPVPMIQDFGSMLIIGVAASYVLAMFFMLAILYNHDRYKESNKNKKQNVRKSVLMFALIAMVAAYIGIASTLCLADPSLGDYKDILTIIAVASTIVALFSVATAIFRRIRNAKAPSQKVKIQSSKERMGFVEKALQMMAPRIIKSPAVILPIALAITIAGVIADGHIETETDELNFISKDVPVIQDMLILQDISGGFLSANMLIEADDITQPATLEWMLQIESQIMSENSQSVLGTSSIASTVAGMAGGQIPPDAQQIKDLISALPPQISRNLMTDDYKAANIIVSLDSLMGNEQTEPLIEALHSYIDTAPSGVSGVVTGMPIIGKKMWDALTGGRTEMTFIGIGMVFGGLLVLFRFRIIRALMATLPIALILGWSSGIMYVLGIKYTPLTSTLSALIIGIGVEFTILLMMRYYEERGNGEEPFTAMVTAMTKIGRAIVASGLTVIGGFGALLIARDFAILSDFGIVTMINVTFALISTLFVLPPLIVWIDSWQSRKELKARRKGKRRANVEGKKISRLPAVE
jgi:hydrophobe/amphiphile efflux-3 (HAE3) family protein